MIPIVWFVGCEQVKNATETEVSGRVLDNRDQPVANATVRLFDLLDNTDFVQGGDIRLAEALIDREAVLASGNAAETGETEDDGRFLTRATPTAFLAVASKLGCTTGVAGFDDETGILNLDTLITPSFDGGVSFEIPTFVIACADPPEDVGPAGNTDEAAPYDPPTVEVVCDEPTCTAAGGACDGDTCVITCVETACAGTGGTCVDGACVLPLCNDTACADAGGACEGDACVLPACDADACTLAGGTCNGADECQMPACDVGACGAVGGTCIDPNTCEIPPCLAGDSECDALGGTCSADGTTCEIPPCLAAEADCLGLGGACSADGTVCELPACSSDEDCEAGQPGATCTNPGDLVLAECQAPDPEEITPPADPAGWTELTVTDTDGTVLADASTDNQVLPTTSLPADGLVEVHATYDGPATTAWVLLQSGSGECPELPPSTGIFPVELADGHLSTAQGDFLTVALHGGYQQIQLSTSEVVGEGERTFVVEIGEDECAPPTQPFSATLTWDAGPGEPADLDLSVWNAGGELVFIGDKDAAWGQIAIEGEGPGPEVFLATDASQGPFTIKVEFFSGRPRDIEAQVRIVRSVAGVALDETYVVVVDHPKDVVEVGVFASE